LATTAHEWHYTPKHGSCLDMSETAATGAATSLKVSMLSRLATQAMAHSLKRGLNRVRFIFEVTVTWNPSFTGAI
jgi:hypothetical protein